MYVLEVNNVSKNYNQLKALNNVSFKIPTGVIAGLIGPNGAGKTTLFSAIAGFIQPDSGFIEIDGQRVSKIMKPAGLLGILPQDAHFAKHMPLRKLFVWYGQMMGLSKQQANQEAERVAELVSLSHALDSEATQLSHGMHKRMALAQALIASPKLIILDEPTAGLDPAIARQIRELIRSLKQDHTVIVSSHNLDEIADICDHITILKKGSMVETGYMDNITQKQSILTFKLKNKATDIIADELKKLTVMQSVVLSQDGKKLQCIVNASEEDDTKILLDILPILQQHGIAFSSINCGATLEERFLEVTQ